MRANGWKRATAVASGIIVFGGAWVVIENYAPWAWAGELRLVATETFTNSISQQIRLIVEVSTHLRNAQKSGNAALERTLRIQIRQMEEELNRLKAQKSKFQ